MNLKEKYADLIVRSGLNVQKDQIVVVRANVEMNEFVRLIVKSCFDVGAKDVIVRYSDDEINRMRYLSGNRMPYDYEALFHNETAEKGACYLSLVGEDPDGMKGVEPKLMANYSKALRGMTQPYRDNWIICMQHGVWPVFQLWLGLKRYIQNQKMHYLICGMPY